MKLVKPGGHLMLMTPANGLCGHGFISSVLSYSSAC